MNENNQNTGPVKKVTIKEFAEIHGLEYVIASSVMKFLNNLGAAKEVGKRCADGGRGKPSIIYELPNVVELVLWDEEQAPVQMVEDQRVTESAPEPEKMVDTNQEIVHTENVGEVVGVAA